MTTTQRLRELLGRATDGEVVPSRYDLADGSWVVQFETTDGAIAQEPEDYELYAESRNALPALLAVVEAAADVCEEWPSPHVVKTPLDRRMAELIAALAALNTEQKTNG